MKLRSTVPSVLFALSLLFCVPSYAMISGTVTDKDLTPVEGAYVIFTDESDPSNTFTAYSDDTGAFMIEMNPLAVAEEVPNPFRLGQNYPNPFNPVTTIPFVLDEAASVNLVIYNIMGQKVATVADYFMSAGSHAVTWDGMDDTGSHVSAGIYLYSLKAGQHSETRKMLLLDGGRISGSGAGHSSASSFSGVSKTAQSTTYTITVTHDSIIPYEETGVALDDSETLDIIVSVVGINPGVIFTDIPGGEFGMGGEGEFDLSFTSSLPVHDVTVSGFAMGIYEVTNSQYAEYLNAALESGDISVAGSSIKGAAGEWKGKEYFYLGDIKDTYLDAQNLSAHKCEIRYYGNDGFFALSGYENYPVVHVTWYGAKAFANYYGFDLPTEAEWEYAARSGKQFEYATDDGTLKQGDDTKAYILKFGEENYHSTEVGCYPPTPFGLYDMVGNVYEWCHDWYEEFSPGSAYNPTGPESGTKRVLRSTYWSAGPEFSNSFYRWTPVPEEKACSIGFRVVHRPGGLIY